MLFKRKSCTKEEKTNSFFTIHFSFNAHLQTKLKVYLNTEMKRTWRLIKTYNLNANESAIPLCMACCMMCCIWDCDCFFSFVRLLLSLLLYLFEDTNKVLFFNYCRYRQTDRLECKFILIVIIIIIFIHYNNTTALQWHE